jgi:hypothetical protein
MRYGEINPKNLSVSIDYPEFFTNTLPLKNPYDINDEYIKINVLKKENRNGLF